MNVEEFPELVEERIITKENAIKKIAEDMYKKPFRYGLLSYDEDFRSEIILRFIQRGEQIFERFKRGKASFRSFLFSYIYSLIITERRRIKKKYMEEKTMTEYTSSEDFITNDELEKRFFIAEKKQQYAALQNNEIWKNLTIRNNPKQKKSAKAALILALKSSYYVTTEQIEEVAEHCKLEASEIQRMIDELNSKIYKKIENHDQLKKKRDHAYYLHKKYFLQINHSKLNNKDISELAEKYKKQTHNWQQKNHELQSFKRKVAPSNRMIARILNICERQVGFYINNAKKHIQSDTTS